MTSLLQKFGLLLIEKGDYPEAAKRIESALAHVKDRGYALWRYSNTLPVYLDLCHVYLAMENTAMAERHFKEVKTILQSESIPFTLKGYHYKAGCRCSQGRSVDLPEIWPDRDCEHRDIIARMEGF